MATTTTTAVAAAGGGICKGVPPLQLCRNMMTVKSWKLALIFTVTASILWRPIASNTVLLPVPTSSDNEMPTASPHDDNDDDKSATASSSSPSHYLQPSFAPSASLRMDDGATYWIRSGHHPRISFPKLDEYTDVEIQVRYFYNRNRTILIVNDDDDDDDGEGTTTDGETEEKDWNYVDTTDHHDLKEEKENKSGGDEYFQTDDCPRHFLWLSDQAVEDELQHRRMHGTWRERVLVEKLYFTLFYGGTGLATKYMDLVDDFQTDLEGWTVMDHNRTTTNRNDHCSWEGVDCDDNKNIIGFSIHGFSLEGTLPTDLYLMTSLKHLDLKGNLIRGALPDSWGDMTSLVTLNMADNELSGSIPGSFSKLTNLENVWLGSNHLTGTVDDSFFQSWSKLEVLDLSHNNFTGSIPHTLVSTATQLRELYLQSNQMSGSIPELKFRHDQSENPKSSSSDSHTHSGFLALGKLQKVDLGTNRFTGTLPITWLKLPHLQEWKLEGNSLHGRLLVELFQMDSLETLTLSNNMLSGSIPFTSESVTDAGIKKFTSLLLCGNKLTGTIPSDLLLACSNSLTRLDISNNDLTGNIPTVLGKMSKLERLDLQNNRLIGSLPAEMNRMYPDIQLNLTNNLLTGTVPKIFCGGGAMSSDLLYKQFGCDAILCPSGTFHPNGAASLYSGCRPCPVSSTHDPVLAQALGRTVCEGTSFVHGDLNGDGLLSEREVLRLLYTYTGGRNWGLQFESWADPSFDKCQLAGITCVEDYVAKIDLTDALLCSNGDRKAGPAEECIGIPAEIALLSKLEILMMNRRQFFRGTLPTEIGRLTSMKYFDVSNSPLLSGPLPSELGNLSNLRYMNLGGCRFTGTIPEELFQLSNIEKLHLSMNLFTGTLSSKIGQLTNVKELMVSRTQLAGSIPTEIGFLAALENLEMYGNKITGKLPTSLGNCMNLKRIDLFNNQLTGPIPHSLTKIQSLQILHIKLNAITGTIDADFGSLPFLSWFDVSSNRLHGSIPDLFGNSQTLKDFRLGGNMIYGPVPQSLCKNENINGGLTKTYGCAGIICPIGTYSDPGHATHADGCKACPKGKTTMYLGSPNCIKFTEEDYITMLYDVMAATLSHPIQQGHWNHNQDKDICSWNGIRCDENRKVTSIGFPLLGIDQR